MYAAHKESDRIELQQQSAENRRDYTQYKIINDLVAAMKFSIKDNREAIGTVSEKDVGACLDHGWGESIKHFRFEDLGSATLKEGYADPYNGGEDLVVSTLKTTNPFNYILYATINNSSLLDIFQITDKGAGYYMSDDPDKLTEASTNVLDDNFFGDAGNYETKAFYLRYSKNVDQSKDIGFKMVRDLEITKVAKDDPDNTAIKGAEFQIYGPFNEGAGTEASEDPLKFTKAADGSYALDGSGRVTTLVTDANGKIKVTGLNWWKEYVIKETKAAAGYNIEGVTASADASAGTVITNNKDNSFTLKLPSTDKVTKTDVVAVKNPRVVKVPLQVEKVFNSYSEDEFTFTFDLFLTAVPEGSDSKPSETDRLDRKTLTFKGSESPKFVAFDEVELIGKGTYTFLIKEVKDGNLPITYDEKLTRTVTVTIIDDGKGKLILAPSTEEYPNPKYEIPDIVKGKAYEKYVNSYKPKPTEFTPKATKTITAEFGPTVENKE